MFTQSQIDQFHHDGTIIAKNLIKGEELEKLQEAADKVVNKGIENAPEDIPNNEKENNLYGKVLMDTCSKKMENIYIEEVKICLIEILSLKQFAQIQKF